MGQKCAFTHIFFLSIYIKDCRISIHYILLLSHLCIFGFIKFHAPSNYLMNTMPDPYLKVFFSVVMDKFFSTHSWDCISGLLKAWGQK